MSLISNKMVQPKEQITKIKKRRTTNASFSKKSQFHVKKFNKIFLKIMI